MVSAADTLSPCYCTPCFDALVLAETEKMALIKKYFKLIPWNSSKGSIYFQWLCSSFILFLIKYFQNIHQQLMVSFLVWPSTDQWEIRVKQSDSSSHSLAEVDESILLPCALGLFRSR